MRECHILRPELFALVAPLRRLLNGRAQRVTMTLADQGVDLLLEGISADGLEAAEGDDRLRTRPETGAACARRRLRTADDLGARAGDGHAGRHASGAAARCIPAGDRGGRGGPGRPRFARQWGSAAIVADLFAGLGTFALALDAKVYAAEGARDTALALKAAGRGLFVDHRDLFRRPLDAAELNRFEAIVLDPPRAGAKEQIPLLAASSAPRIAYVSCNPATFARDARMLIDGGYRLDWVQPVGQFRWSTHVELASCFSR